MSTDEILNFFIENKVWFIAGIAIIILAIIGFIANKKKWLPSSKKKELSEEEAATLEFYDGKVTEQNQNVENSIEPEVDNNLNSTLENAEVLDIENNTVEGLNTNNEENNIELNSMSENNNQEQVVVNSDEQTNNMDLYVSTNPIVEETNNEEVNDFSFDKKDFVPESYNDFEEVAEKEAQEIEEELNESNVWIAHDDEIFNNEVSSYNEETKNDNINNENSSEIIEPVLENDEKQETNLIPNYETTPVVPSYEETPMITPFYGDVDEVKNNNEAVATITEAEEGNNVAETLTTEEGYATDELTNTEDKNLDEENVVSDSHDTEIENDEKVVENDILGLPDFELPKFEAPNPISFSTVDEDLDRLNDMNFTADESIDLNTKSDSIDLDDTMQISYEQLKSMVDDIIAENKSLEKTSANVDNKTEESFVNENNTNFSNNEEEQQDDEDDVWKF